MATSQDEKDARRRKIRELEASLFNNEWTSEKTDLPQLKNVNEYSIRYGNAEPAQNQPRPKSIKQIKRPTSIFKMRKKSKDTSSNNFDKIPLIVDDDDADAIDNNDDFYDPKKVSKTQKLLKSEVEQLDEAFNRIFQEEPSQSVIENLKKKHGLLIDRKPKYQPFDTNSTETTIDKEKRNMDAFQAKMNRARMTDQIKQDKLRTSRSRRQSTTTILSHEEKNLSIQGQKLVPLAASSPSFNNNQPNIILSPSEKQRRGLSSLEQHEKDRLAAPPSSSDICQEGMISYAHLEMIPTTAPGETFKDLDDTFDKMPTNTFQDMAMDKTFDDIPNDVFDKIPRAVSARAERRLIKLQEQMLQEKMMQNETTSPEQVSFIAALFSTDKSKGSDASNEDGDDNKEDFLLALFIAQQDPVLNQSRPGLHQTKSEEEEEDKSFGHFCAPWVPGFCEANFCIFHNPIEDHSSRSEGNMIEHNKAGS